MKVRKLLAVTLTGILAISTAACGRELVLTRYDAQFLQLFDTVTSMVEYAKDKKTFTAYVQELHDELGVYHRLYDIYHEHESINNLKTINDNARIEPVVVDGKIIGMLEFAKELNTRTNGYFNMTMESALSIRHEYRTAGIDNPIMAELSPMETLEETGKNMDINDIAIDGEASTVYLADANMGLDVGAIVKSCATEMICRRLGEDDLTKALVNMGGDVRAISTKDDSSKWKLGIQDPDLANDVRFLHVIAVIDMSLVTSGDYQRYYTVGGVQYHRIVNPNTLMPWFEYDSVSILCKDSRMADALPTAVSSTKQEDEQALIESLDGVKAMWLHPDGSERYSSGLQAYMEDG